MKFLRIDAIRKAGLHLPKKSRQFFVPLSPFLRAFYSSAQTGPFLKIALNELSSGLKKIGLTRYSLRVAGIQRAGREGWPLERIMSKADHHNSDTTRCYLRGSLAQDVLLPTRNGYKFAVSAPMQSGEKGQDQDHEKKKKSR
jgi:hypothetical protein